jgi:hypothetical protein
MGNGRMMRALALSVLAVLPAAPGQAIDGAREINQTRATLGGVSAGDTPGFPVTIDEPGSYVLTGNLAVADENTTAIRIESPNVVLDLNGFEISGTTICSGTDPVSCTPTGGGTGVFVLSSAPGVVIRNGTVRGMGGSGVSIGANNAMVEGLQANSNGSHGIDAGSFCLARGNIAYFNGKTGIRANLSCTVTESVARKNGLHGIEVGPGGLVTFSAVHDNDGDGIVADAGSGVTDNAVNDNEGFGLDLHGSAAYVRNTLTGNNGNTFGTQTFPEVDGGVETGANVCGTDTVCP